MISKKEELIMKNINHHAQKFLQGIYERLLILAEFEPNDIVRNSYVALARTLRNQKKGNAPYARENTIQ